MRLTPSERIRSRLRNLAGIESWCKNWHVRQLGVFGSVLREDYRGDSDIDFAARFENGKRPGLFNLIAAEDELATIAGRPVDLLDLDAVERDTNFLRREHLLSSVRVIYDSGS